MNNWWKLPVLQGPENDYGDYDYLVTEVPSNTEIWSWRVQKCEECKKERRLNINYADYFITMDGWDSFEYCECWKCYLKRKIVGPFKELIRKIKKCINARKDIRELNKDYKKSTGRSLPKERQKKLYKIFVREI